MKRIYTTLALVGAMVTGAFAQRHANIQGTLILPTDPGTPTVLGCTDSFPVAYVFVNKGPDAILATDTMQFNDAFTNIYESAYQVTGTVFNVNDTVIAQAGYVHLSDIVLLVNAAGSAFDTTRPFNGDYIFPALFGGFGWSVASTAVVDTTSDDDLLGFQLTINCGGTTGISKTNLAKNALTVFPNPANNEISFKNEFTAATTANVTITDIAGRVVKTMAYGKQNAGTKTFNIDIADLNNGMYYIELVTESTRSISKFTKN